MQCSVSRAILCVKRVNGSTTGRKLHFFLIKKLFLYMQEVLFILSDSTPHSLYPNNEISMRRSKSRYIVTKLAHI